MFGIGKVSADGDWIVAGSITTQQSVLGVDGRDTPTADALTATGIIKINNKHPSAYAFLFRFRSDDTENIVSLLELYAARGIDHYHHIGRLEITPGTQADTGAFHFCDAIGLDNNDELFEGKAKGLENSIAHYYVRTLGFDKFLVICSQLSSNKTIYIDYCPLYE